MLSKNQNELRTYEHIHYIKTLQHGCLPHQQNPNPTLEKKK